MKPISGIKRCLRQNDALQLAAWTQWIMYVFIKLSARCNIDDEVNTQNNESFQWKNVVKPLKIKFLNSKPLKSFLLILVYLTSTTHYGRIWYITGFEGKHTSFFLMSHTIISVLLKAEELQNWMRNTVKPCMF